MRKILTPFVAALLLLLTLAPQTMWATNNNASVDPYLTQPLTIEMPNAGVTASFKIYFAGATSSSSNTKVQTNLQYRLSSNGGAWGDWTNLLVANTTKYSGVASVAPTAPTLGAGTGNSAKKWKVQLRGVNPDGFSRSSSVYYTISLESGASTRNITVYGNVMSLIVGYDTDDETAAQEALAAANEIPNEYCFYRLFHYISSIGNRMYINASNLIVPATKLKSHCYEEMFYDARTSQYSYGLQQAPTFLATDFVDKDGHAVSSSFAGLCKGCQNFSSIHVNFTSPSPDGCIATDDNNLTEWLKSCSTQRTIYAPEGFRTCFASANPNTGLSNAVWNGWTKTQWVYEFPAASTYTLAWSSSGSTPTGGTAEGSYAAETSLTAPTTSKDGYTVSKWRDETNGVDFNGTMPGNDVTYTAQWTANTYYVSFDAGEGSGTMTDQTFTYDEEDNLKANTFTGPAVTVTYDYNDATGGDSPASETVNASFANWTDGETPYDDGEEVSNLTTTNGATVELTAEWDFDQVVTLPSPTKTGYTFVQWEYGEAPFIIIAGGSGDEFIPDEDVTLTAHWNAITYNLTYEGLEGATNSNPASYTVESEFDFAAPGTREGWTFTGWTCGGEAITSIALGTIGDKTITANWTKVLETFDLEDDHAEGDAYYTTFSSKVTAGERLNIRYVRNFTAGVWATFSLPFGYSFNKEGNNTFKGQVYYLISAEYTKADGYLTLNCMPNTTGIVANKPYVLIPDNNISNPVFNNVALKSIGDGTYSVSNMAGAGEDISFINTQVRGYLPRDKRVIYFSGTSANKLYYSNESKDTKIRAFRGYFYLDIDTDDIHYLPQRVRLVMPDGETIEQTMDEVEGTAAETRKYMENGILVIERNGVKYDAQGHVIK